MSESGPKLLDLILKNKEWVMNREGEARRNGSSSDENKKLELRLGLPGDEGWCAENNLKNSSNREKEISLFSLSYFSEQKQGLPCSHNPWTTSSSCYQTQQQQQPNAASSFLHPQYKIGPQGLPVVAKESPQPCRTRIVELRSAEKKAFSPVSANTAVPNSSQKRAAPAPVVGWPPIRSFRKNLSTSSTTKTVSVPQIASPSKPLNEKSATENLQKGLFVKINMDGIPIGRKVDLHAYDGYEKLSFAVDELFRGLLAAQRNSSTGAIDNKQEEQKPMTGLLDGSGEYTLVYEDNEGDRILVGDVPWHMFVSTVKRLRVLKSSDVPTLNRGGSKEGKLLVESVSK